ncbi:MAG: hypothetical protein Kow0074_15760 [Candidatus Zixiibacteriota bacterium]
MDCQPVHRYGNVFYFVMSASQVSGLSIKQIPHTVVEDSPFQDGVYYMMPAKGSRGLAADIKASATRLDQFDDVLLVKDELAVAGVAPTPGDGPQTVTRAVIPLTYLAPIQGIATSIPSDSNLDSISTRINQDSVLAYDTYLMNLQTRNVFTAENDLAQAYLESKFLSFGYTDVKTDTFDVFGSPAHNVICTKTGTTEPDKVIVIGAHYDSYNTQSDPLVFAPGADDNGSGTVCVLEIARALADIPTNKTIIFVAFDGEEYGLYGSEYFAQRAFDNGMDIELMMNLDMVGYDPANTDLVWLMTEAASEGYASIAYELSLLYSGNTGVVNTSPSGGSDHVPFRDLGYRILYAQEYEFNTGGWHTNVDIVSRLDMSYLADVARVMGTTAYAVAVSPAPVENLALSDYGDGTRLLVEWDPSTAPDVTGYKVHVGPASGVYNQVYNVPGAGSSSFELSGLTEGNTYYIAVSAVGGNGWSSISAPEASMQPLIVPRTPSSFVATVDYQRMELTWDPAVELDFDHYVLLRGTDTASISVFQDNITAPSYTDYDVQPGVRYFYQVQAVDGDLYASGPSPIQSGIAATFDQGILVFDLTWTGTGSPTQAQQDSVYNSMFSGYPHGYYVYDDYYLEPVDRSVLGQYEAVFWIDDDFRYERWRADHFSQIDWFLSYGNTVVIIGWTTAQEMLGSELLNDDLRVTTATRDTDTDCIGGVGANGFPNVIFDTTKVMDIYSFWGGALGYMFHLTPADPSCEVIYTYDSDEDDPVNEQQILGVRRDTGIGKVALVSMPLYYIREADAKAMIATFGDWFGAEPPAPGDLNIDTSVDVLDISMLADIVFAGQTPYAGYAHADVNATCSVNVLDLVYLIDYVFRDGDAPVMGCE